MITTTQIPCAFLSDAPEMSRDLEDQQRPLAGGCSQKIRQDIEPSDDDCDESVELVEYGDFCETRDSDDEEGQDTIDGYDILTRFDRRRY